MVNRKNTKNDTHNKNKGNSLRHIKIFRLPLVIVLISIGILLISLLSFTYMGWPFTNISSDPAHMIPPINSSIKFPLTDQDQRISENIFQPDTKLNNNTTVSQPSLIQNDPTITPTITPNTDPIKGDPTLMPSAQPLLNTPTATANPMNSDNTPTQNTVTPRLNPGQDSEYYRLSNILINRPYPYGKMSTDLIQLVNSSYFPIGSGMNKNMLISQWGPAIYKPANSVYKNGQPNDEMVYCVIALKPSVSSSILNPYVWEIKGEDNTGGKNEVYAWVEVKNLTKVASLDQVYRVSSVIPATTA
jgi:hypothetical protein